MCVDASVHVLSSVGLSEMDGLYSFQNKTRCCKQFRNNGLACLMYEGNCLWF